MSIQECFDDLLRALGADPEKARWELEQERIRDLPAKRVGLFCLIVVAVVVMLMIWSPT